MTVSANDIVNMALANIGASSSVEQFEPTPEDTTEAHQAALWYHPSRKFILELYDWGFARTRLTLALDSNAAPSGIWTYRYQYPSDCVAARYIEQSAANGDTVPFSLEQPESPASAAKTILTDEDKATLVYTRDVVNPAFFPPVFIEAFVNLLSYRFVSPLTGDLKRVDFFRQAFMAASNMAATICSNQEVDKAPREASWIRDR